MEPGPVVTDTLDAGPVDAGAAHEERLSEGSAAHGERLAVPERVIVAPTTGRFRPASPDDGAEPRTDVAEEEVIGYVEGHGQSTPVRSPFRGSLMGMLAHAGERVREGQPVAWLRLA